MLSAAKRCCNRVVCYHIEKANGRSTPPPPPFILLSVYPRLAVVSFGMSSYGRMPGGRDQGQGGEAFASARASNSQASSSAGGHVGSIGWQAPEVIADRVSLEGGQGPSVAGGVERWERWMLGLWG